MEFLPFFIVMGVVVAVILLKRQRGSQRIGTIRTSTTETSESSNSSSAVEWNHSKPDIPAGHQIYLKRLSVSGVQYHRENVYRLAVAKNPALSWERQSDNEHDENAIAIYGHAGGQSFPVGYVDKNTAANIAAWPSFDELSVRFEKAGYRDSWVDVVYQVTGPKGRKKEFEEATGS